MILNLLNTKFLLIDILFVNVLIQFLDCGNSILASSQSFSGYGILFSLHQESRLFQFNPAVSSCAITVKNAVCSMSQIHSVAGCTINPGRTVLVWLPLVLFFIGKAIELLGCGFECLSVVLCTLLWKIVQCGQELREPQTNFIFPVSPLFKYLFLSF